MDILILKTNINSKIDFLHVKGILRYFLDVKEVTIDLEDCDKVMRIIGKNFDPAEIISKVNGLGFRCEELPEGI